MSTQEISSSEEYCEVDWALERDGVSMVSAELELLDESDPEARRLIEDIRQSLQSLALRYDQLRKERM